MKNQPYDVILLPPQNIAQQAIDLSKKLSNTLPTEFVLDGVNRYPHITLYQIEIPTVKLQAARKKLSGIFKNLRRIRLKLKGFSNHETFVFWDVEKTEEFLELHEKIVRELNPLRNHLKVSIVLEAFNSFNAIQQKELDDYGAIGVLQNFHPHLTLTRMKKLFDVNRAMDILSSLRPSNVTFEKGGLGLLSTHGTVVRILEEYNLE